MQAIVSSTAQITLPNEFANKTVYIDKISEGVIQIKTVEQVIESEKVFHTAEYKKRLEKFDTWMNTHIPVESNLDELFEMAKK